MDILYETIRNICAFVILTTVVNNLLHESVYQKYVRFFTGLVLILIVVKPIVDILSNENVFAGNIEKYLLQIETSEFKNELMLEESRAYSDTSQEYIDILDKSLEYIANEQNLKLIKSSWEVEMDPESDRYGQIISLKASAGMSDDIDISEIRIDENDDVSIGETPNSSLEIRADELTKASAEYFNIDEDCINIKIVP